MLCLRNPQKTFGLARGTMMCCMNMGINELNARNVIFNDVFDLVVPNYFLSTFSPTKGYYILTCPEKTSKQLRKFFDHIFKCEKCLKIGGQ